MGGCYSSRTVAEGHHTYYSSMSSLPLPSSRASSQSSLPLPSTKPVTRHHSGKRKDVGQDDSNGEVVIRRPHSGRFGFGYKGSTVRPKSTDLSRGISNNVTSNNKNVLAKTQSGNLSNKGNVVNGSNQNGRASIVPNRLSSSALDNDKNISTTAEDNVNANVPQNDTKGTGAKSDETSKGKSVNGSEKNVSKISGISRFSSAKPRGPLLSNAMSTSKDKTVDNKLIKAEVKSTSDVHTDTETTLSSDLNKNVTDVQNDEMTTSIEKMELSDVPDGSIDPAETNEHIPNKSPSPVSIQAETNILRELSWQVPPNSSPSENEKESDANDNSSVETLVPERQQSVEQKVNPSDQFNSSFRRAKPTLKRAPLARFDSLETTSMGSINSDDLMLETDIGFDDDDCLEESQGSLDCSVGSFKDHSDKHYVHRMLSRSDSLRDGKSQSLSRCSSQSHDSRENSGIFRRKSGDYGDAKFLRPRSKSGPGDSQSSLNRIVRRTSLPRSSNLMSRENSSMNEGSKMDYSSQHSDQSQPLQELGHLINNTTTINRRQKLIRSERPASFPGLGLSDVASPRSRTGSASGILKPPRQPSSIDDEEQYMIDGHTLRNMLQELTMFKTMLLKVKRYLQEDELGSPFGPAPSWKNGFKCVSGSVPSSPLVFKESTNSSSFSFSEKSISEQTMPDNDDKTATIEQLNKERNDLRQQLAALKKHSDEQGRTIQLLQQQMTKYECGNIGKKMNTNKLSNSASQTDKPRFPLSRSLLAKPNSQGKNDDNTQVISGSSEKIADGKFGYKNKSSKLDMYRKNSRVSVHSNGIGPKDKIGIPSKDKNTSPPKKKKVPTATLR